LQQVDYNGKNALFLLKQVFSEPAGVIIYPQIPVTASIEILLNKAFYNIYPNPSTEPPLPYNLQISSYS